MPPVRAPPFFGSVSFPHFFFNSPLPWMHQTLHQFAPLSFQPGCPSSVVSYALPTFLIPMGPSTPVASFAGSLSLQERRQVLLTPLPGLHTTRLNFCSHAGSLWCTPYVLCRAPTTSCRWMRILVLAPTSCMIHTHLRTPACLLALLPLGLIAENQG